MPEVLDQLRRELLLLGATKLAWSLEQRPEDGDERWSCSMQAANEMGAPVELPPGLIVTFGQAVSSGALGAAEPGVWIMDLETGRVSRAQPRPGDGAGAPGIAERMP